MTIFRKDPEAVLDFAIDWSDWLQPLETIVSYVITVPTGIVKDSASEASGVITMWLSGGTAGTYYSVEVKIVTNAGRTDERTMKISVEER
jgi:TRAP-type uncharacterized transport system substrate-binding protein